MKKISRTIKIGRHESNDYVLSDKNAETSRNHAALTIYQDGSMEIEDFSSNGTYINGNKINNEKKIVTGSDVVSFADQEVFDWSKIGNKKRSMSSMSPAWLLLPILLLGGVIFYMMKDNDTSTDDCDFDMSEIQNKYDKSVGLIVNAYFLKTVVGDQSVYIGYSKDKYEDNQSLVEDLDLDKNRLLPFFSTGTGFLIANTRVGDNANLVTNRHVAHPAWQINNRDYVDKEQEDFFDQISILATQYEQEEEILQNPNRKYETDHKILKFIPSNSLFSFSKDMTYQDILDQLVNSNSQVQRWSKDESIDIALLSADIVASEQYFISLDTDVQQDLLHVKVGDNSTLLGYSGGIATGFETDNFSLDYQTVGGNISKDPTQYTITYDVNTTAGSSGSPVFDECGKLVAVHFAKQDLKGLGIPIKRVLSVLNDENVAKPASTGNQQYK